MPVLETAVMIGACASNPSSQLVRVEADYSVEGSRTDQSIQFDADDLSSTSEFSGEGNTSASSHEFLHREGMSEWTTEFEERFDHLCVLDALSQLGDDGMAELEALTAMRRRLQNPLDARELLFQYESRRKIGKLIAALDECAMFFQIPRKTGESA